MKNSKPLVTIALTQYNELENLKAGVIDQLIEYMQKQKYTWEIIINDDGSTDGSREYVDKYTNIKNFTYIKSEHKGKAGGLATSIKKAKGEWTLLTDIDQSTPIKEIGKLLPYIKEFDTIIGSRGIKRENSDLIRLLASFIFRVTRKILILNHINDTQCGFKLFNTDKLKLVFPELSTVKNFQADGWNVTAFDIELLFILEKMGSKIKEVEVIWRNEDISNSKNRKFVNESISMLKQIFSVILRNLRGEYKHITSSK